MKSFFAAVLVLVASSAVAAPRPISDTERAAVEMAADYLSRGPAAIVERLDNSSPLRRLTGQELLDEIEARLGPPNGARWELQTVVPALQDKAAVFGISYPSGLDESVTFTMTPDFHVLDLRILAMQATRPVMFAAAAAAPEAKPASAPNTLPIAAGVAAALLAILAAFVRRARIAALAAVAIAATVIILGPDDPLTRRFAATSPRGEVDPAQPDRVRGVHLANLLPLRRAMTAGTADASLQSTAACHDEPCATAAALWKAQAELQQQQTSDAERALAKFTSPSNIPLAEILRGRESLLKENEADAAVAFESAINLGPGRDGLWFETAEALSALGFED
ncbi:MAG TPA: hypothetical protein VKU62_00585, partial [Thermoanaerobaculia bacterium]|nr:hypothetical protein [Thermoanaerobaculia bacterium]